MWSVWPVFIVFYHFVHSANNIFSCKNETVCNHGFICQEGVCEECIKCALLFRKGSDCESNFNDCGQCLPGYKEISTTNFSNVVKPCRPERLNPDICTNDEDCPIGSYCYKKFCAVCFNCTLLNKLPPSNGCAKDFNGCGFCIDGFYELPVTTDSVIKPCERKTPELKNLPKLVLSFSNILPFCILTVFVAVVIKLLIKKNKEENDAEITSCEQSLSPSAPPLFVSDISDILREEKNEKCSTVTFVSELKQQANTARVFKQPHALYYFAEEGVDDASEQSNDSNDDGTSPPQRSEPEEACSPSIFVHRYAETRDYISPSEEINESMRDDRDVNVSVDNVDSQTTNEDAAKFLPQTHDSSPKS